MHLGEVLRDLEQSRRLERRGDGLPDIVGAIDDHAVDRRNDLGVAKVRKRLRQCGDGLLDLRRGAVELRVGVVDVRLRRQPRFREPRLAVVRDLRVRHFDARLGQVGLPLLDLRLERRGVELGQELSFFHVAVEVGVEAGDDAGHLAADLDGGHGREGAGRCHGHGDVAAIHFRGLVLLVVFAAPLAGGDQNE